MGSALTFYDIRIKQSFDRALKEKYSEMVNTSSLASDHFAFRGDAYQLYIAD